MLIVNAEGEGYDEKLRWEKDVFSSVGLSKYYEKIVVATRQMAENFTDLKTAVDHGKRCLLLCYMTRKCAERRFFLLASDY